MKYQVFFVQYLSINTTLLSLFTVFQCKITTRRKTKGLKLESNLHTVAKYAKEMSIAPWQTIIYENLNPLGRTFSNTSAESVYVLRSTLAEQIIPTKRLRHTLVVLTTLLVHR